eukprot:scaffold116763_cov27-Prasinocladus_malaysianus.AAC.2
MILFNLEARVCVDCGTEPKSFRDDNAQCFRIVSVLYTPGFCLLPEAQKHYEYEYKLVRFTPGPATFSYGYEYRKGYSYLLHESRLLVRYEYSYPCLSRAHERAKHHREF